MRFFQSNACASGAHCNTCRDKVGGKSWRLSVLQHSSDVPEVDFACPKGRQWGEASPLPQPSTFLPDLSPEEVARIRASAKQGGCCGAPTSDPAS